MKYYRIGEFARLNRISVELLKYYDRQGLLRPAYRDESGIRYYADFQVVHLAEYYQINQLGISLQDARALRESGSLQDWQSRLARAQTEIEREIREKQAVLRYLSDLRERLESIQENKSWYLEWWDGGFFVTKEQAVVSQNNLARNINEIWQRVILQGDFGKAPEHRQFRREWGTLLPLQTEHTVDAAERIPGGICFVFSHSIPAEYERSNETTLLSGKVWSFERPLQLLSDNGHRLRGDLYQRRLCVTHEADGDQVQVLTRIPLVMEPAE